MNRIVAYVHAYVGMGHNAGAEETLHDMLRHLVANGWEADVVVSQPYPGMSEYSIDGVNVHPQVDKRTIIHWIPRASVVISHLECSERATLVARKYRIPSVQLVHNDMPQTHGYVAMGPDAVVFNTEWVQAKFDVPGVSMVVHPAVDGSRYATESTERNYITLVNLWPNKGSDIFYRLAERLPEFKFLGVMGGYGEQDVRDGYSNVTFQTHTSNMASVYARSRLVIMPSVYESFGRVAVEAASQGIPSIVSNTPGLIEALGDAGIYVDPKADDAIDLYVQNIRRLKHWKAYKTASDRVIARYSHLKDQHLAELNAFTVLVSQMAETGRLLRGW